MLRHEEAAVEAVQAWLQLLDEGKYADSWDQSAKLYQHDVTKQQCEVLLSAARMPLGKVLSRKLKSKRYTGSLPGAPVGEYVVIQFETSFENNQSAIETVMPMKDKDGKWRVSGYYIK